MKRAVPFSDVNKDDNKRGRDDGEQLTNNNQVIPTSEGQAQTTQNHNSENHQGVQLSSLPSTSGHNFSYYSFPNSNPYQMMSFPRMWQDNSYNMNMSENNMNIQARGMPFFGNVGMPNANRNETQIAASNLETNRRSPSPVTQFCESEIETVISKLEDSSLMRESLKTVMTWLQNGECTKSTCDNFIRLIHAVYKQVWRLMVEKSQLKDGMGTRVREKNQKRKELSNHFAEIMKVIEYSSRQKVWDQFTRGQRKQLTACFTEVQNFKDELGWRSIEDDECDDQDNDDQDKSPDSSTDCDKAELDEYNYLQDKLDTTHHEIKALQEDSHTIRLEEQEVLVTNRKVIGELFAKFKEEEKKLHELKDKSVKDTVPNKNSQPQSSTSQDSQVNLLPNSVEVSNNPDVVSLTPEDLRLMALIAVFLNVHRDGASIDYIHSYAVSIAPRAGNSRRLESLLQKCPKVFAEKQTGIGCTLKKNWVCLGLSGLPS